MTYKSSKQRDVILEYMKCIKGHVNADTVFEQLNQDGCKISLATIYRNLNILSDMKEIKKIALPDGYVYDKTCTPHYHFYCTSCSTLYDLSSAYNHSLDIQGDTDSIMGRVDTHELTFKGICKHCQTSKKDTYGGH